MSHGFVERPFPFVEFLGTVLGGILEQRKLGGRPGRAHRRRRVVGKNRGTRAHPQVPSACPTVARGPLTM